MIYDAYGNYSYYDLDLNFYQTTALYSIRVYKIGYANYMYGTVVGINTLNSYNPDTPIAYLPSNIKVVRTLYGLALFRTQNAWSAATFYTAAVCIEQSTATNNIKIYGNANNIKSCNGVTLVMTFISTT